MRRGIISRRSLLAAPALLLPREALAWTHGSVSNFPGQLGNPVGFAATPAIAALGTPAWPGSFQNANPVYGNAGLSTPCRLIDFAAAKYAGSGGVIPSGTAGSPTVIAFQDFISQTVDGIGPSGSGPTFISVDGHPFGGALSNVTFIGCRFQANAILGGSQVNVDCATSGSGSIVFKYCSITPLASLWTSPVLNGGGAWPSSSVGTGVVGNVGAFANYCIPYADGNFYGIFPGNTNTMDHCDVWGCCNHVGFSASSSSFLIQDCWVHDARNMSPPIWNSSTAYVAYRSAVGYIPDGNIYGCVVNNTNSAPGGGNTNWQLIATGGLDDHTDMIGFSGGGGNQPSNQIIRHCTAASLGTAVNVSMQEGPGHYVGWIIDNNYISGCQTLLEAGDRSITVPKVVSCTITNNVMATDLKFTNLVNFGSNSEWTAGANGNLWRNNRLRMYPGDNWSTVTGGVTGQYVYPDGTNNNSEFV